MRKRIGHNFKVIKLINEQNWPYNEEISFEVYNLSLKKKYTYRHNYRIPTQLNLRAVILKKMLQCKKYVLLLFRKRVEIYIKL